MVNYVGHLTEILQVKAKKNETINILSESNPEIGHPFVFKAEFTYNDIGYSSTGRSGKNKKTAKQMAAKSGLIKLLKDLIKDNPSIDLSRYELTEHDLETEGTDHQETRWTNSAQTGNRPTNRNGMCPTNDRNLRITNQSDKATDQMDQSNQMNQCSPKRGFNQMNHSNRPNSNKSFFKNQGISMNSPNMSSPIMNHRSEDRRSAHHSFQRANTSSKTMHLNGNGEMRRDNQAKANGNCSGSPNKPNLAFYGKYFENINCNNQKPESAFAKTSNRVEDCARQMARELNLSDDDDEKKHLKLDGFRTKKHKNEEQQAEPNATQSDLSYGIKDELNKISSKLKGDSDSDNSSTTSNRLPIQLEAFNYLQKNIRIIQGIIDQHDAKKSDSYSSLIDKLCKLLPKLNKNYHIYDDKLRTVGCVEFSFENECLYKVFEIVESTDQAIEQTARKLFQTIRLQFAN